MASLKNLLTNVAGYGATGTGVGSALGQPVVGGLLGAGAGALRSLYDYATSGSQNNNQPNQNQQLPNQLPSQRTGNSIEGYSAYGQQTPLGTPQQMQAVQQLLPGTVKNLQGNQFDFGPIEEKSNQNFRRNILPLIAGKYSALGNENTPAAQYALSNAAAEHSLGLAGLRSQYGLQQRGLDQNLLQQLLQPQFESQITQAQPGLLQGLSEGGIPGATDFATKYLSGLLSNQPQQENQLGGSGTSTQNTNQNDQQQSFGNKALQAGGTALTGALVTELINYLLSK